MPVRPFILTLFAGAGLLVVSAQSLGLFHDDFASLTAPCSMLLALPLFLEWPVWLVLALAPLAFWFWSFQLFYGRPQVPIRSVVLFAIATFASALWFVLKWHDGIGFHGSLYTFGTLSLNLFLVAFVWLLTILGRRSQSFLKSLVLHCIAFAWLVTYAFPYLVEPI